MGGLLDYAPTGLSVASGQLGAYAARSKGRADKRAADINASLIEREAALRSSRMRTEARREIGRQRTEVGASGLLGSPLELVAQNASELERAAMEETLAGQYNAAVTRMGGKEARKQARKVSAAALFEGITRGAYYGRVPLTGTTPRFDRTGY